MAALVHDLRQPLSNIALSASYIEMILDPEQTRILEQVSIILRQVERASAALEAAIEVQQAESIVQMDASSENLFLRKAQSAAEA